MNIEAIKKKGFAVALISFHWSDGLRLHQRFCIAACGFFNAPEPSKV